MGKVVQTQRKGKGGIFKSHVKKRIGVVKMRKWDYAEKHGFVKGVIKEASFLFFRSRPTLICLTCGYRSALRSSTILGVVLPSRRSSSRTPTSTAVTTNYSLLPRACTRASSSTAERRPS